MATAKETAETAGESNAKQDIADELAKLVYEKTQKRIGRAGGKQLFDTAVKRIFESAVKEGSFRFPGGFGALHIRHLNKGSKPKRLPSGATTTIGEGRKKLRYVEGNEVKDLMGTKKAPKTSPETAAEPTTTASPA